MKTKTDFPMDLSVAATVSGEDVVGGDFVTPLTESVAVPSYMWDSCAVPLSPDEPVRVRIIPEEAGAPLKVIATCLPFIYAKTARGKIAILDTRRVQIVRLDRRCAKTVWKAIRARGARKSS